jgi:hypothetical protein
VMLVLFPEHMVHKQLVVVMVVLFQLDIVYMLIVV